MTMEIHDQLDLPQSLIGQNRSSAWRSIISSFRVWLAASYVALLLLGAVDIVTAYQQFDAAHLEVARLAGDNAANSALVAALDQRLIASRDQVLYRGVGLLLIGACIALGMTYAIGRGLLRPLHAISQVLVDLGTGTGPPLDQQAAPTELRPLVQHCNNATAALNQRQQELLDQLQRTALLTRLSIELRESSTPKIILQQILAAIVSNMDVGSASIITIDSNTHITHAYAVRDGHVHPIAMDQAMLLLDKGLAGWVLRQGYDVVIPDRSQDERWLTLHPSDETGSAMALLITHSRATLGVLTITHPECRHFTSKDLLLLEGVAAQAGVALGSMQRHIEAQYRREQALLLFAMSQSFTVERSLDDLASELLQKGYAAFDAFHTALFLCKSDGEPPELFAFYSGEQHVHVSAGDVEGERFAAFHSHLVAGVNDVWRNQQAASGVLHDALATSGTARKGWNEMIPGYVALPLLHNGTTIGVFVLVCATNGAVVFSADMWSLLTTFTNVTAAAFANIQLVERLQERAAVLEEQVSERTMQLQHSRDLLRIVFDNLPDGLVLLDQQTNILTVNHAFCRGVLGVPPQQVVSRHYPTIMRELQQSKQVLIEPPLGDVPTQRIRCTVAGGENHWYQIDRYAILSEQAEKFIERWRDITLEEQIHRQLMLHEQMASMGRLALSVVHEVGNPLQSVRGCLDLCREEQNLSPRAADYLALADTELERMSHILERLRDLYRPPQMTWAAVSLNDIIATVQRITERQLKRYHIQLEMVLEPTLPPVYAQKDALYQVVLNLILNAQEAMPSGGSIRIKTAYDATQRLCGLEVSDTGIGIAPNQLEHIFEPFNSGKAQGLGLGLYLSKQVVDRHQGRIEMESVPGESTTVTVWLPQMEQHYE